MNDISSLLEAITGQLASEERLNDTKLRAFAWARVSTEEQDNRGDSIKQQFREIRAYAEREGIEIVGEFHEAVSAFSHSERRIEFNRMIEKAKAVPDINVIIVHDFSRFSRDSVDGRALFRELRKQGIQVKSVSDPDLDPETLAGLYAEAFTFAKNEAYSREIAFHTIKGCRANCRNRDPETGHCFKNGGMPLWGYKIKHVQYGIGKGNKPIYKSIWVLDDTIVAGKPMHEWVKYCLVELAMKGASYAKMRDYYNNKGIPGRKDKFWNVHSFTNLLTDFNLLKYAGYGVWNVRGAHGRSKPVSEWEIVEDAHHPIITEEEAITIGRVRREAKRNNIGFIDGFGRARKSNYLLSGGISVCDRCGKNLIGHRTASGKYYVCGSEPYRGGKGCGPGVYVPQLLLESQVIEDIQGIITKLADPVRFTRKVNEELRHIWEEQTGYDPDAEKRIMDINHKITHIHKLLEDGLDDVEWANGRLRELKDDRRRLEEATTRSDGPLQVDPSKAMAYRTDLDKALQHGKPEDRKEYVQAWLDRITLYPDDREVEIRYTVPESITNNPIVNSVNPGSREYPVHQSFPGNQSR